MNDQQRRIVEDLIRVFNEHAAELRGFLVPDWMNPEGEDYTAAQGASAYLLAIDPTEDCTVGAMALDGS